jgi:hypothetical protein
MNEYALSWRQGVDVLWTDPTSHSFAVRFSGVLIGAEKKDGIIAAKDQLTCLCEEFNYHYTSFEQEGERAFPGWRLAHCIKQQQGRLFRQAAAQHAERYACDFGRRFTRERQRNVALGAAQKQAELDFSSLLTAAIEAQDYSLLTHLAQG